MTSDPSVCRFRAVRLLLHLVADGTCRRGELDGESDLLPIDAKVLMRPSYDQLQALQVFRFPFEESRSEGERLTNSASARLRPGSRSFCNALSWF